MASLVRQTNTPIETEEAGDGSWIGRLVTGDVAIEVRAGSQEAAQSAVVERLISHLQSLPDHEADRWFAEQTTLMPEGFVPECFVESSVADPIATVLP